jgi:FMN reductase
MPGSGHARRGGQGGPGAGRGGPGSPRALRAVAISGSPSPQSKSRRLLDRAVQILGRCGIATARVDLLDLPADGLLGRRPAPEVAAAVAAVGAAQIVVVASPIYRATYTGLLKVFFDLLPRNALAGKVCVPIATGGVAGHRLAIDYGLVPLFASLGGVTVPTGTYGTDDRFEEGEPHPELVARLERAIAEAVALAGAMADAHV